MIYDATHKSVYRVTNIRHCLIFGSYLCGMAGVALLMVVWPSSTASHLGLSWALFVGAGMSGVLAMTSYCTLYPFAVYSQKKYTTAISCGMGSASLVAAVVAIIQGFDENGGPLRFSEKTYFAIIFGISCVGFGCYLHLTNTRGKHLDLVTLSQSRPEILIREDIIDRVEDYFSFFRRHSVGIAHADSESISSSYSSSIEESDESEKSFVTADERSESLVPPHQHLMAREGTWKDDFASGREQYISMFISSFLLFSVIGLLPFLVEHVEQKVERMQFLVMIDCVAFISTFLGRCCLLKLSIKATTVQIPLIFS